DLRIDRDLAEKRDPELLGGAPPAAVLEDLVAVTARRALVVAHVLDDPEERHVDLLEHREPLARVDQRNLLRRRDDDRPGELNFLRERQLRVAGSGRQIDEQKIEL